MAPHTRFLTVPKKAGACPGPSPVSWGLEHENPRRRRRARQSGGADRVARAAQRHRLRARAHRGLRRCRHDRRQRLRRRSPSVTRSPRAEARSSSRQSATEPSSAPMTPTSTKSATSSSASSTSSNSSAAWRPDTTSCSPTSWASSNSPLSQAGSNSNGHCALRWSADCYVQCSGAGPHAASWLTSFAVPNYVSVASRRHCVLVKSARPQYTLVIRVCQ
jgi:hypothetical protein